MYPTITLKKGTVLYHATNKKTDKYMEWLRFEKKDSADCSESGNPNLRTTEKLQHYETLADGEFPTSLDHPKWFSLPPHRYDGDVHLNYVLERDVVLADLRGIKQHGPSVHPTKAGHRDPLFDTMQYIARCVFPPTVWPYYYYAADEYDTEWPPGTLPEFKELHIDGWVAYFDSHEMAEVAIFKPQDVINPRYTCINTDL